MPNPTFRRGLSERSEFPSHMIRHGGEVSRRAAHGRTWFWVLLPKQKDLVGSGETLHIIKSFKTRSAETWNGRWERGAGPGFPIKGGGVLFRMANVTDSLLRGFGWFQEFLYIVIQSGNFFIVFFYFSSKVLI